MKNLIRICVLATVLVPMFVVPQQPNKPTQVQQQTEENEETPLQTRDYEEFLDKDCCDCE